MATDFEVFKGKSLSNLFEDIYVNQVSKKRKISDYIEELKKMVRHSGDVAFIGPVIKDLIDTSVKNDEHLVKLATIAQRIWAAENKGPGDTGFLSAAEKKQLLQDLEETKQELDVIDDMDAQIHELKRKANAKAKT